MNLHRLPDLSQVEVPLMPRREQMSLLPEVYGGDAIIEDQYRYLLRRWWGPDEKVLLWILLNPSTADGLTSDATLRRCMDFTHREGYHRLAVVNLYAWRSPDPKELRQVRDPIGPLNDHYIAQAGHCADKIIIGWGNNSFHGRDHEVLDLLGRSHIWTFGLTNKGQPRHPFYLKRDEPLIPLAREYSRDLSHGGKN
jgi:hypothetical protein